MKKLPPRGFSGTMNPQEKLQDEFVVIFWAGLALALTIHFIWYKVQGMEAAIMEEESCEYITRSDILRLMTSRFRIVWRFGCYTIRDTKWNTMVAIGFDRWVDALAHLEEDLHAI